MSELSERIKGALLPKPLCRDCADRDGRCHDGEFCDPEEQAKELSELVKALQQSRDELLEELAEVEIDFQMRFDLVKASRDELLEALKRTTNHQRPHDLTFLIQKAEAQKEATK